MNTLINFIRAIKLNPAWLFLLSFPVINAQPGGFTKISVPDMNAARMECRAAVFPDSSVVIFGGHIPGFERSNNAEILSPNRTSWLQTSMSDYRDYSAMARIDSNRVMLAGGMSSGYGVGQINSTEIYDYRTKSFTPAAAMHVSRTMFSGTRLKNGNLLFVGNWYNTASTAEIYNLSGNSFSQTGNVITERCGPYIVPMSDNGAVVFGGGTPYGGNVETIEVFNYQTNSFSKLRDNLIENETGWKCSKNYPNSSFIEEDMTIDGKFYFSAFRELPGNGTQLMVLSLDPDSLKFSSVFTNEDLLSYAPGDSLYPYLAGKVMVDKKLKRVYFWVNQVLLSSAGAYAMSLYYWDISKKELFFSPGYQVMDYVPMMGVNITLPDGKLLIAGGNYTSNFDAHQHCFIAAPVTPVTGIDEFVPVFNHNRLRVYPEKNQLRIFFNDIPSGEYTISINDLGGRCIQSVNKKIYDGAGKIEMPLETTLPKGCYFIGINNNQQRFNAGFITF